MSWRRCPNGFGFASGAPQKGKIVLFQDGQRQIVGQRQMFPDPAQMMVSLVDQNGDDRGSGIPPPHVVEGDFVAPAGRARVHVRNQVEPHDERVSSRLKNGYFVLQCPGRKRPTRPAVVRQGGGDVARHDVGIPVDGVELRRQAEAVLKRKKDARAAPVGHVTAPSSATRPRVWRVRYRPSPDPRPRSSGCVRVFRATALARPGRASVRRSRGSGA